MPSCWYTTVHVLLYRSLHLFPHSQCLPRPQDPDPRVAGDLLRPTVDTPTPRFLSLDNPLVATALLIAAVGVVSSLLSR